MSTNTVFDKIVVSTIAYSLLDLQNMTYNEKNCFSTYFLKKDIDNAN